MLTEQIRWCPINPVQRKTIRWYKKIIFHLLDVAVWNSYYIFKEKTGSQMKFIEYREAIIRSLTDIDYNQDGRSLVQFKRARIQTNEINYNETQHFPEKISQENVTLNMSMMPHTHRGCSCSPVGITSRGVHRWNRCLVIKIDHNNNAVHPPTLFNIWPTTLANDAKTCSSPSNPVSSLYW